MGLIVYLLAFWALSALAHQFLWPKGWKVRRYLKALRTHARDRRTWDRDLLSAEQYRELEDFEVYIRGLEQDNAALPALRAKSVPEGEREAHLATIAVMEQRLDLETTLKPLSKSLKIPTADRPNAKGKGKKAPKGVENDPGAETMKKVKSKVKSKEDSFSPEEIVGHVKGVLEMLVVVLGVVMGLRGLFLQPFKIPTGSMQPTLYGVHFEPVEADLAPGPVLRLWNWVNYGERWVSEVAPEGGPVYPVNEPVPGNPIAKMIFPKTTVGIGRQSKVLLPGNFMEVLKYLTHEHLGYGVDMGSPIYVESGDVVARGNLIEGDHLFVDRVSYNFRDPQRGDIVVFNTTGIRDENNEALAGLFFIKRLVGMPGETIRVSGRRLYVRAAGETEFRQVTGEDHPGFERMYSMKGDYRGYVSRRDSEEEFEITIGEGQYLFMGDNSENSKDGRYFGTVPRANIVGRACMVWWPFSRRFGPVDRVEPLDYPSDTNPHYER